MSKDEYYLEIEENKNKPVIFSDDEEKSEKKSNVKWSFIIMTIILIYLFYKPAIHFILDILKANPTLYSYFLNIESEISNNTLSGLFLMTFFGSLFFLLLPSEAIFIYYLSATTYNPIFILLIIVFGTILGLLFNYFFGKLLGEKFMEKLFGKEKYYNYKEIIDKYGGYLLFFGNIIPGPIEVLAVFYGSFRFRLKKFIYLSFFGRLIKYILIFLAFYFFWDKIVLYYENFLNFMPFLAHIL